MTKDPPENRAAGSDGHLASGDYGLPSKSCPIDITDGAQAATALKAYSVSSDLLVMEVRYA